jgi:hypothetical protein
MQYMTGENSLGDIREQFEEETGDELPEGLLEELLNTLDEHYLLENERAQKRMESVAREFHASEVREASLPGQSIPSDPDELTHFLEETLPTPPADSIDHDSEGLVVPHIDFMRGKETYAATIPYMKSLEDLDRIIMLGISHYACSVPFALTDKSFETPLGTARNDSTATQTLNEALPYDLKEGETAHRLEHSIEIPLLLLQYARPELDFELVPIICSYRRETEHENKLESFVDSLKELSEEPGTYVIAGVDFAHMGPQFGDREPLSESDFESIENHDRDMIEQLEEADPTGFENHIQSDQNRRRVCGYPALRTVLPLFDEGELIDYDQWQDPQETVTYASLVMQ